MVKINEKSIIEWQIENFINSGISVNDIVVVTGYKTEVLEEFLKEKNISYVYNKEYMTTNMVCSLMCVKDIMLDSNDIVISYGDIVYKKDILDKILSSEDNAAVCVDLNWLEYWKKRCENPLDDAETLKMDEDKYLLEIGQKTNTLDDVQAQYIGLMRFKNDGLKSMVALCEEAQKRSMEGKKLWRTDRDYAKMYMTDLLQGMIDTGNKLKAIEIKRGWFEVDCISDLKIAEKEW